MPFSVIEYYGKQNSSRCGYCKKIRSCHSHGMHAYIMSPQDYQDLIDRGWRRSGQYCYKPNNKITCCPSYTIRCDALEFKLTKSHKKILKRMNKFLMDGVKDKGQAQQRDASTSENLRGDDDIVQVNEGCIREEPEIPNIPVRDVDIKEILQKRQSARRSGDSVNPILLSSEVLRDADGQFQKGETLDDSRPPRKKAKQMRLERKQMKLAAKGVQIDQVEKLNKNKNQEKTLREYINGVPETSIHKLKVILVSSNKGVTAEEIELYRKYQMAVHHDPLQKLTQAQFERFLIKSPLKLTLVEVTSSEFKATLQESFGLYQKYQTIIHNDPPDCIEDYLMFLVKSPLRCVKTPDAPPDGYGSFHQQYWLDDKLIAVGVIDILPYCISSVYFFYDPGYSFLSLGTYGSLREIDFTRQLSEKVSSLKYYYMGFYIHSCPKMRYKGKLVPSYLLCPEIYSWHLLTDEIRTKLDEVKYQRFNEDVNSHDDNEFTEEDINSVLISIDGRSYIRFGDYVQPLHIHNLKEAWSLLRRRVSEILGSDNFRDIIMEYGKLTGRICAKRMVFIK